MTRDYIFDLDGTLVDSQAGVTWAATQAVATVLPEMQLPDLRAFIGPPIDLIFARALSLEDTDKIAALVAAYRELYDTRGYQNAVVYCGVEDTLRRLGALGARCFVVTNKPMLPTSRMLQHFRLDEFLAATLSPDSPGGPFTNKASAVASLLREHKVTPAKALLLGDSRDDAQAAAENGIPFVAAAYGYGKVHAQSTWPISRVLYRFAELL